MFLKDAGANALNTSGAHNDYPKRGRRPKAAEPILGGAAGGRPNDVLRFIKSIGLCIFEEPWPPILLKTLVLNTL